MKPIPQELLDRLTREACEFLSSKTSTKSQREISRDYRKTQVRAGYENRQQIAS